MTCPVFAPLGLRTDQQQTLPTRQKGQHPGALRMRGGVVVKGSPQAPPEAAAPPGAAPPGASHGLLPPR